jgi:hypothetical protein
MKKKDDVSTQTASFQEEIVHMPKVRAFFINFEA